MDSLEIPPLPAYPCGFEYGERYSDSYEGLTAYGLRLTAYGLRLTAYGLRLTAYGLRLADR